MKNKRLKKLIQKPLRFHHQDIHEELEQITEKLDYVICQMQNVQERINQHDQNAMLWMSKPSDGSGRENNSS
jgi:peptidoglycan hydrolase CwlO-like protein